MFNSPASRRLRRQLSPLLALLLAPVAIGACDSAPAEPAASDRAPLGKADNTGSCETADKVFCGGISDGNCFCDADCVSFGDCCHDAADVCFAPEGPTLLFSDGLDAPESVAYDPQTQTLFVSNLAHNILETDPLHPPRATWATSRNTVSTAP